VPSIHAAVSHFEVMHSATAAKAIAELVRGTVIRWSPEQVELARKTLRAEPPGEK
jgi:hypothetical protein